MINVEQIVTAQKDQAAAFYDLANKAVAGVEQVAELNLKVLKSAVAESAAQAEALLNVKDVQGLVALGSGDLKGVAEKANAYGRELYEIAQGVGSEFAKAAEVRTAEAQKQFTSLIDSAAKSAPNFQNAVAGAANPFESMQKVFKQATEQATTNFNNLTSSALNAVETVKVKKAA